MTATANEGKSRACQGLHNAPILAYVSPCTVQLTVACRLLRQVLPPRREDECIGC
jgi:hypothetical protein